MTPNRLIFAFVVLTFPWLAQAGSETQQYCNEMYPADSYEPADRSFYVQECMDAYSGSDESEPEVEEATEEASYYEGTVEEFVEEQPAPDTEEYSE